MNNDPSPIPVSMDVYRCNPDSPTEFIRARYSTDQSPVQLDVYVSLGSVATFMLRWPGTNDTRQVMEVFEDLADEHDVEDVPQEYSATVPVDADDEDQLDLLTFARVDTPTFALIWNIIAGYTLPDTGISTQDIAVLLEDEIEELIEATQFAEHPVDPALVIAELVDSYLLGPSLADYSGH